MAMWSAITLLMRRLVAQRTPADDAWFYTPAWQAGEREADADLAAGRFTRYMSEEELEEALAAMGG